MHDLFVLKSTFFLSLAVDDSRWGARSGDGGGVGGTDALILCPEVMLLTCPAKNKNRYKNASLAATCSMASNCHTKKDHSPIHVLLPSAAGSDSTDGLLLQHWSDESCSHPQVSIQ